MITEMEPRTLLQQLMDRDGLNSNSLAARLDNTTTQPQIHKFLSGKAKEPRRSTLAPVAAYFKIPLEALYDAELADVAAAQKQLIGSQPNQPSPPEAPAAAPVYSFRAQQLARLYDDIPGGSVTQVTAYVACTQTLLEAAYPHDFAPIDTPVQPVRLKKQRA